MRKVKENSGFSASPSRQLLPQASFQESFLGVQELWHVMAILVDEL
jgi:hypothetical protein